MAVKTVKDMFIHKRSDVCGAEKQITRALTRLNIRYAKYAKKITRRARPARPQKTSC